MKPAILIVDHGSRRPEATRDIPQLVQEAARAHTGLRIRITEPLGLHESLVDVVLARVDEASH